MSVDRLTVVSPTGEQGVALLARLVRLLGAVEELNRQLERVEAEMQDALGRTTRERFEAYR